MAVVTLLEITRSATPHSAVIPPLPTPLALAKLVTTIPPLIATNLKQAFTTLKDKGERKMKQYTFEHKHTKATHKVNGFNEYHARKNGNLSSVWVLVETEAL